MFSRMEWRKHKTRFRAPVVDIVGDEDEMGEEEGEKKIRGEKLEDGMDI